MEWSVCQHEVEEPPPWGLSGLCAGTAVLNLITPALSEALDSGPRDINFNKLPQVTLISSDA